MTIICGTGHRPEDCDEREYVVEKIKLALADSDATTIITGMAAGFDLWLGRTAIDLGYEVWAAKPWAGHRPRAVDQPEYAYVEERAAKVIEVNKALTYLGPFLYHDRNHWMVDHADKVLAYWSGKQSGGTYACIQYANKMNKPIRNIYGGLND